jgi:hypothetical protein
VDPLTNSGRCSGLLMQGSQKQKKHTSAEPGPPPRTCGTSLAILEGGWSLLAGDLALRAIIRRKSRSFAFSAV